MFNVSTVLAENSTYSNATIDRLARADDDRDGALREDQRAVRFLVRRALSLVAFVALTASASDRLVLAQAPSLVLNACHVSPIVHDLDVAAHFYHDVLGLDLVPAPPAGALPVDTDPGHLDLHGVPKARLRFIGARMPGVRCGIELVEFTGVDRRPVHRRYQDPGSTTLVLTVRNLDAAVAAVKKEGRPVVTTGGAPVRVTSQAGPARALTVQDPDQHYVELVQPDSAPETNVPATSNVIGIGLRLTGGRCHRRCCVLPPGAGD